MGNRILVKLTANNGFIHVSTISRECKSPWSIAIARGDFITLERDGHVIVRDMFSFAELQRNEINNTVTICFTWLNNHGCQYVGWKQTVVLPYGTLMDFVLSHKSEYSTWKVLSIEPKNEPQLVFAYPKQLRTCVENKIVRRKLVRFLRDNFKWRGVDKICFYGDFEAYSFFFREFRGGTPGIAGGLIYNADEDLSKGYYSIHTFVG